MEYPKEYWIDNKCRYWLSVSVTSCRRCLFNTLCHLEHDKELREKEEREKEGTLNNNANTNENATTEIIND